MAWLGEWIVADEQETQGSMFRKYEPPMLAWVIPSALELPAHTIQPMRITDAVQCYCDGVCVPVMCGSIADSSGTSRYCISWDNTDHGRTCERACACVQASVVCERPHVQIRMNGNAWETSGRTRDVATHGLYLYQVLQGEIIVAAAVRRMRLLWANGVCHACNTERNTSLQSNRQIRRIEK
jgi:hypothetical protein